MFCSALSSTSGKKLSLHRFYITLHLSQLLLRPSKNHMPTQRRKNCTMAQVTIKPPYLPTPRRNVHVQRNRITSLLHWGLQQQRRQQTQPTLTSFSSLLSIHPTQNQPPLPNSQPRSPHPETLLHLPMRTITAPNSGTNWKL